MLDLLAVGPKFTRPACHMQLMMRYRNGRMDRACLMDLGTEAPFDLCFREIRVSLTIRTLSSGTLSQSRHSISINVLST